MWVGNPKTSSILTLLRKIKVPNNRHFYCLLVVQYFRQFFTLIKTSMKTFNTGRYPQQLNIPQTSHLIEPILQQMSSVAKLQSKIMLILPTALTYLPGRIIFRNSGDYTSLNEKPFQDDFVAGLSLIPSIC